MKMHYFTDKKIRFTYKLAVGLYFFSFASTIINLIYNIVSHSDKVFFSSYYLLLVPYFNFTKTHNYFEIIAFIIFFSISLLLFYKSAKEFFDITMSRGPFSIIFSELWLCAIFLSEVAHTFHDPIPCDNIHIYNGFFIMAVLAYQVVVMFVKICDIEKYTLSHPDPSNSMMFPQNFQLHAIDYKQIFRTTLLNPCALGLLFVGCLYLRYFGIRAMNFVTISYVCVAIMDIIIFIEMIYEYKRLLRLREDLTPPKNLLRNINLIQIGSFVLLIIMYILFFWI